MENPAFPTRVLIVDDDGFMRDGLRLYLESQGFLVQEASGEATAWEMAGKTPPDVAVIDISIPPEPQTAKWGTDNLGIRLARRLKAAYPPMGIVLLSAYEYYLDDFWEMLRAGQRGLAYKLKGRRSASLLEAIHLVLGGHVEIDPEVHAKRPALAQELTEQLTPDERPWVEQTLTRFDQLTPQELKAANLLAASHNQQGIAQRLGIHRADTLVGRVYSKLGLNELSTGAPHLRQAAILIKACLIRDLQKGEPR